MLSPLIPGIPLTSKIQQERDHLRDLCLESFRNFPHVRAKTPVITGIPITPEIQQGEDRLCDLCLEIWQWKDSRAPNGDEKEELRDLTRRLLDCLKIATDIHRINEEAARQARAYGGKRSVEERRLKTSAKWRDQAMKIAEEMHRKKPNVKRADVVRAWRKMDPPPHHSNKTLERWYDEWFREERNI